ncbi:hypothetical protein J2W23_000588 [Variovorax boronicumulans]|uniref:hypothetical protein n=1 Tax=Variovorax boronicumulans TaxID=436515 RepID=UPI002781801E|nr:hypothetical protein [Variovorax boronicumulans]MDQ0012224.1 hypothetical protein [Variovorax boronicumulans]
MAATLNPGADEHPSGSSLFGPQRYWAPCLAVALVAVSLFYVTLKDLVREHAARATPSPPAVMQAYVEAKGTAARSPEKQAPQAPLTPYRAPRVDTAVEAPAEPQAKAAPAFVEVQKCVMPEGDAVYSDSPCPEGASASTLRLPRNLHAAARL